MRDHKRHGEYPGRVLGRTGQPRGQPRERVVAPAATFGHVREPPQRPHAEQEQQAFTSGEVRHVDEAHRGRGEPRRDEAGRVIGNVPADSEDQENGQQLKDYGEQPCEAEREELDRSIRVLGISQLDVGDQAIPERLSRRERVCQSNRHIRRICVQARIDEMRRRERAIANHRVGELHLLIGMPLVGQSPVESANAQGCAEQEDQGEPGEGLARRPAG